MKKTIRPAALMLAIVYILSFSARGCADGIFGIPDTVKTLEDAVFEGIPFPNGVYIPEGVSSVAPDAFGASLKTVYGVRGSFAESYARAVGAAFEPVSMKARLKTVYLNNGMTVDLTNLIDARPDADGILWSVSDAKIATVNAETGKITALAPGNAYVTAVSPLGLTARIDVKVVSSGTVIKTQKVSPAYAVLTRGETVTVTASASDCSEKYKSGTWFSTDPSVATVPENSSSSSVTVTAVGAGSAYICALSSSGVTAKCEILVNPVVISKIEVSPAQAEINPGDALALTAIYSPSDADAEIDWISSAPDVASVTASGVVRALKGGQTTVTARTPDGISASCAVTVKPVPMTEAALAETEIVGEAGAGYDLHYTFLPENATPAAFVWTTDDASVAVADAASGRVTFVGAGVTTVRGTAADGSGLTLACDVYVTETPVTAFELNEAFISLNAGETGQITYRIEPGDASYGKPRFTSDNPEIARVDENGVVEAVSPGNATISATAGRGENEITRSVSVTVTSNGPVTYRLLVIGEYSVVGKTNFLPFSENSTKGVRDAFSRSVINGNRYTARYVSNPTPAALKSAIGSLAAEADSNDVSVIYLLTHGAGSNASTYVMGTSSEKNLTGAELLTAVKGVSGHVVLVLCTCHSGRMLNVSPVATLMNAGGKYTGKNGPGILSILCSATDTKSCYYDVNDTGASYDFFSRAFSRALGWDMIADRTAGSPKADRNGDGLVTLGELAPYLRSNTQRDISSYVQLNGFDRLNGNPNQYPTWRFGSGEEELVIFGKKEG